MVRVENSLNDTLRTVNTDTYQQENYYTRILSRKGVTNSLTWKIHIISTVKINFIVINFLLVNKKECINFGFKTVLKRAYKVNFSYLNVALIKI